MSQYLASREDESHDLVEVSQEEVSGSLKDHTHGHESRVPSLPPFVSQQLRDVVKEDWGHHVAQESAREPVNRLLSNVIIVGVQGSLVTLTSAL